MCTLSYLRIPNGYSLMMNRDESPLRPQPEQIKQPVLHGDDGLGRRGRLGQPRGYSRRSSDG